MKRLFLPALILMLSGCATLGQFNPFIAKYDMQEYSLATNIRLTAITTTCNSKQTPNHVEDLNRAAMQLYVYSEGLPHNQDIVAISANLFTITSKMQAHYELSTSIDETYCLDKIKIIDEVARKTQTVIGALPR